MLKVLRGLIEQEGDALQDLQSFKGTTGKVLNYGIKRVGAKGDQICLLGAAEKKGHKRYLSSEKGQRARN